MRLKFSPVWASLFVAVPIVFAIGALFGKNSRSPSAAPWNLTEQSTTTEEQIAAVVRRKAIKREIADAVVRGALTPDEAAVRFRLILTEEPFGVAQLRNPDSCVSDEELALRHLAFYVRLTGPSAAHLASSLETEAARRFPPRRQTASSPGGSRSPSPIEESARSRSWHFLP